ncbi:hypothetical protein IPM19_03855 [bacterium]|nr:MAG: hypothetical protein IPM19_03855 [bacterium]
MKAIKQFFLALFSALAALGLFAAFVGFINGYFGYNAGMFSVWIFLGLFFVSVIYFNYRDKSLPATTNIKNLSTEAVKGGFKFVKIVSLTFAILIGIIISIGAFIYIAAQIGKLGALGIIIVLLIIIIFQISSLLQRLDQ